MFEADAAMGWSLLAHLSAREREMLPAYAATAHDAFQPYDAELHPVRAAGVPRSLSACACA